MYQIPEFRIVDRGDREGLRKLEEDFDRLEERASSYELAFLLEKIALLKDPPMDDEGICEVIDGKIELHMFSFTCRRSLMYFGFAFSPDDGTVYLLGVFWKEGHFSACDWIYEQACQALRLVNPARERVGR